MPITLPLPEATTFPEIRRKALTTLQVNLGYRCNQACVHCHVNAGPKRTEMMAEATLALIPRVLRARAIATLDLTGGAPELHPWFRTLVRRARALGVQVLDRCNLTILREPGHEDLAEFLAEQSVAIVASLPCYSAQNVDRQRGRGVFERSIAALRQLNALGYGKPGGGLVLNLVYNPAGPNLPPDQEALERDYRFELNDRFGIVFNHLFTLTNMPINRFARWLDGRGELAGYRELLKQSHRGENLDAVMCRGLISVDWRGRLYDCDFNQQLGLSLAAGRSHLRDLLHADPQGKPIRVADHCFGCTAGGGSGCGGALTSGERA